VIDERLDYEIIAALADALVDGHVILAGPVVKVDPAAPAPQERPLHGAAKLCGAAVAARGRDVALMPFALNRATASISPTKTLEYFAARRPVVSTAGPRRGRASTATLRISRPVPTRSSPRCARRFHAPAERIARGVAIARETPGRNLRIKCGRSWGSSMAALHGDHRRQAHFEILAGARENNDRTCSAEHRRCLGPSRRPEWEDYDRSVAVTSDRFDERFAT